MPLYLYECGCGEKLEVIVSLNEKPPQCKNCKKDMKKVPSSFAFRVNGYSSESGYSKKTKKEKL